MGNEHIVNGMKCKNPKCWCQTWKQPKEKDDYGFIESDMVNEPDHYKLDGLDIEAIDVIRSVLTPTEYRGYLKGNCLKYLIREKKKNGDEDLRKHHIYSEELDKLL